MKRKLRAGVLTSLLLTPAALANAEGIENNHSDKNEVSEVSKVAKSSSTEVPKLTVKEEILLIMKKLNEKSTKDELTLAKSFTLNDGTFTEDERKFLTAKITYVENTITQLDEIKLLGTAMTKLTLTNAKLIQETPLARIDFDKVYNNLTNTQEAFKLAVTNASNDIKIAALGSALQYGNDERANHAYLKSHGADVANLIQMEKVIVKPEGIKQKFIDLETMVNVAIPNPEDIKDLVIEIRDEYKDFSEDEKKVMAAHIPDNATKAPYATYAAIVTDLSAAEKVDESITKFIAEIAKPNADFTKLIAPIDTAFNKLSESAQKLLTQKDVFESYQEAYTVTKLIAAMRISNKADYRDAVTNANKLYDALDPIYQGYVSGADKLKPALAQIAKAEIVEAEIGKIASITNPLDKMKAITTARTAFDDLDRDEQKIVNNLTALTTYERMLKAPLKVDSMITALKPESKDFEAKTLAANVAFNKLTDEEKKMVLKARELEILLPYAELSKEIKVLRSTMPNFTQAIKAAKANLTTLKSIPADASDVVKVELGKLLDDLEKTLLVRENEEAAAAQLVADINALTETDTANFMSNLQAARDTYNNKLSPESKKLVTNIKILTDYEKKYKPVSNVMLIIDKLDNTSKDYVKKVAAAQKAYDKLTSSQKGYVTNYDKVSGALGLVDVITKIDKIKISAKNYRELVTEARKAYTALSQADAALVANYTKLTDAEKYIVAANAFDQKIEALSSTSGDKFVAEAAKLTAEYKKLDANVKKLVQNANTLLNYEKENRAVIKVINLIDALNPSAKDYAKKVLAAQKAYNALDPISQKRVTNINELKAVEDVATLIILIDSLKSSSKTFLKDVEQARKTYDALTAAKKAQITNYDKLLEAEQQLTGASAVILLIDAAQQGDPDYLDKLMTARVAYDKLQSTQKKLVTNYKDLTEKEKAVKPVLSVMVQIESLSPDAKDFVRKTEAARAAYLKLSKDQKSLVSNISKLNEYEPIAKVIDLISTLKSSSKTFHVDTAQARVLYNALKPEHKLLVSNYYLLEAAEASIKGAAHVDALILGLSSVNEDEYIKKIDEARAAYNALPSSEQKAVQNYKKLQDIEKMILPVKKVVDLIEGIFTATDMAKQYQAVLTAYDKLTTEQRKYVYNDQKLLSLSNVIAVYKSIAALNPSDKNYFGMIISVRKDYDSLSTFDKQRVGNYDKLLAAENGMAEVKKVVDAIAALSSSANTYFEDVERVAAAYKALDSKLKGQVLNYQILQLAEKNIIAAKKVIQLIAALDPDKTDFESKLTAADKAYKALTVDQQKLVYNAKMLEDYLNGN